MTKNIVAIVGTYRKGGVIDTAVDEILKAATYAGIQTTKIYLIDKHIEFCTNCRSCMQQAGSARGTCRHKDDMAGILEQIENAQGLIIASPLNFSNITAVTRKFLERLVVYGYWPWGQGGPKIRITDSGQKAVLVTSSAAPALVGKIFFRQGLRALKAIAKCFGAKVISQLYFGMAAQKLDYKLNLKELAYAYKAGVKMASSI